MKTSILRSLSFLLVPAAMMINSCLPDGDFKTSVNFEPAGTGDGWVTGKAGDNGFNPDKLQDIYEMMFREDLFITSRSLLIVRNGKLVSESYFRDKRDIDRKNNIQGLTKSITSLMAGIVWDGEYLDLDEKLYGYLPGYFDGDLNKREITINHVLTMTTGLDWDRETHDIDLFNIHRYPSTLRIVLTKPFVSPAGSDFFYNHGTPQLLMGVMKHVVNLQDTDSVVQSFFGPLGINDFIWEKHTDGLHIGGLGLHLKPRDLARIGKLCLQKGMWRDVRVVSEEWIDHSTRRHISPEKTGSGFGYGYFWWTDDINGAYFAMGDGGQYLYLVPSLDMVIVHTASPSTGSGYKGIKPDDFFLLVRMIIDSLE